MQSVREIHKKLIYLLLILLIFGLHSEWSQSFAQSASIDGRNLHIPVLVFGSESYLIDLLATNEDVDITDTQNPSQFQLSQAILLSSAAATQPSTFANSRLFIPNLEVDGAHYDVAMDLLSTDPVLLQTASVDLVSEVTGNVARNDALVISATFDNDIAPISYDSRWMAVNESEDNLICNSDTTGWATINFGQNSWENYAIEADIKQLNDGEGFEFYLRMDSSDGSGFRASLYNLNFLDFSHYPPGTDFPGVSINAATNQWIKLRAEVFENDLKMYLDDSLMVEATIDKSIAYNTAGVSGIGAAPGTEICINNVNMWAIDANGPVSRDTLDNASDPNDPRAIYEGQSPFAFIATLPNAPQWDLNRGGYVPAPEDSREQVVIDQTFRVNAGETIEFNNQIVWIRPTARGPIEVQGTLLVRDSLLLWDQSQHQQTRLKILDGGTLDVTNSLALNSNPFWVNWDYESGSTILLDNYVGDPWTAMRGSVNYTARNFSSVRMTLFEDVNSANVSISDAHHVWLELFMTPGEHHIVFPEKLEWLDWNMNGMWPNSNISMSDSYIFERDITIFPGAHATLHDTPSGFSLGWIVQSAENEAVSCELIGLGDPGNEEGVLYSNHIWNLTECNNSSLRLQNSRLQGAWPVVNGRANLTVRDSNLVDIRNFGSGDGYPSGLEIYNSSLLLLAAYNGSRVYVENSTISSDIEVKDSGTTIYGFNVTLEGQGGAVPVAEIDGGTYIEQASPGRPW